MEDRYREHPLLNVQIFREYDGYPGAWLRWKEKWDNLVGRKAQKEEFISLLHEGFTIRIDRDDEPDRICFYLSAADGWSHIDGARFLEKEGIREIARKALKMLILQVLNLKVDVDGGFLWAWKIQNKKVFQKLLWFLDNGHNTWFTYRGAMDHDLKEFLDFIPEFLCYAWDGGEPKRSGTKEVEEMFRISRPDLVRIMIRRGRTDLLLANKRWKAVDHASYKVLEGSGLQMFFDRYPSLEAASHDGRGCAPIADTVLLIKIRQEEERRLKGIEETKQKIQKAESQKREAEKKLRELSKTSPEN